MPSAIIVDATVCLKACGWMWGNEFDLEKSANHSVLYSSSTGTVSSPKSSRAVIDGSQETYSTATPCRSSGTGRNRILCREQHGEILFEVFYVAIPRNHMKKHPSIGRVLSSYDAGRGLSLCAPGYETDERSFVLASSGSSRFLAGSKACSLRCSSSPRKTRFAGLLRGPQCGFPLPVADEGRPLYPQRSEFQAVHRAAPAGFLFHDPDRNEIYCRQPSTRSLLAMIPRQTASGNPARANSGRPVTSRAF